MSLDGYREVFEVLRRNKLRSALTALSVAWGIFMLVVLIAAGNGLRHGVEHDFRDDATNSIWIQQGKTSLSYDGHLPGRPINFETDDIAALKDNVDGLEHLTGRYYLWGGFSVSRGGKSASFDIRGCHPDHQYLERTIVLDGRFINDLDIEGRRKVAVIGTEVKDTLFGTEDPLGQMINIRGVNYKVVGLFEDQGGEGELRKIYIPISTAQLVYHGGNRVHQIMYTTGAASLEESKAMADETLKVFARRHNFDPKDRRAVRVNNNLIQFQKLMDIFDWIRTFVWVVGIGTLFAGVVGVSNIMLISVQERTLEIGIRKALGATPGSVVSMVLTEALILTSVAGYCGLTAGMALVETVRLNMPANDYIRDPSVDVRVGVIAMLTLVAAGALAGLIPALRAAAVRPVVAMREA
jgi:putative ABC transport system permease protein